MELKKEEMYTIDGGGITSQMLNAISKAVTTLYDLGRATGSAIRRLVKKLSPRGIIWWWRAPVRRASTISTNGKS